MVRKTLFSVGFSVGAAALCSVALWSAALATPAAAEDSMRLGWGRLFTNDALADGHDRWRTGGYTATYARGPKWAGSLPDAPGVLTTFGLSADTIAPASLTSPAPGDRRYAGVVRLMAGTQFERNGYEATLSLGVDVTGNQTGLGDFQSFVHNAIGIAQPSDAVLAAQIGNAVRLAALAELGHTYDLGHNLRLRPFVSAELGNESLLRAGFDLDLGGFTDHALMGREGATGQRYRIAGGGGNGLSFTFGGDIARVYDSVYYLSGDAAQARDTRRRLRIGMHGQYGRTEVFYGITYLGPEFVGQKTGQTVGSISLRFHF
ncbi:MAG: DUF2219 family protein [Rhodobacteraceae bacterium]|nr:DUF2219 family protein [Paracoccaceae bacterium]